MNGKNTRLIGMKADQSSACLPGTPWRSASTKYPTSQCAPTQLTLSLQPSRRCHENYFEHWVFGMATVWDVKDAGCDIVTQVLVNEDVTHCPCLVDDRCCELVNWGTSQLMFTHLESNGAKAEARHSDCVALSALSQRVSTSPCVLRP